jgi:Zn-finger in ubiquitin-hydrolases and other protein
MGLLQKVRSALQRVRGAPAVSCTHLDQIHDVTPQSTGCAQCLELGDSWVHLRMCMTDGQVGCCDSSKNKHASRHAREHAPEHQIARSMERGEDWLWCFADEVFVSDPGPKA